MKESMKCNTLITERECSSICCSYKVEFKAQNTFSGAFRTLAERKWVSVGFNLSSTEVPACLKRKTHPEVWFI